VQDAEVAAAFGVPCEEQEEDCEGGVESCALYECAEGVGGQS
jgi:hypothetical protein